MVLGLPTTRRHKPFTDGGAVSAKAVVPAAPARWVARRYNTISLSIWMLVPHGLSFPPRKKIGRERDMLNRSNANGCSRSRARRKRPFRAFHQCRLRARHFMPPPCRTARGVGRMMNMIPDASICVARDFLDSVPEKISSGKTKNKNTLKKFLNTLPAYLAGGFFKNRRMFKGL